MFKLPTRLEEWIALNAAPVTDAGDGDNADDAPADPVDEGGDGDNGEDGNHEEDGDSEEAPGFSLFATILPSGNYDLFDDTEINVGYPPAVGDVFAEFDIDLADGSPSALRDYLRERVADQLAFSGGDVDALNDFLRDNIVEFLWLVPSGDGPNRIAPQELDDAIQVDAAYHDGVITVSLSFSRDVRSIPGLEGTIRDLRWEGFAGDLGRVRMDLLSLDFSVGSPVPPFVPPGDDTPSLPVEPPPPPGIIADPVEYRLEPLSGPMDPAFYIFEEFDWGEPSPPLLSEPPDIDELEEFPEAENIILAVGEARRQFGRLELAVARLQDASVDNVEELDDSAVDAVGQAMNQGNAMLGSLTRELDNLFAMARNFSGTDPELRDGVMLEGIEDGAERALETSGQAGVLSAGLEAMTGVIQGDSGETGGGELIRAFGAGTAAAAAEAAQAAARRDGAETELDVYKARLGAAEKKF